jgi:hypothetical protein
LDLAVAERGNDFFFCFFGASVSDAISFMFLGVAPAAWGACVECYIDTLHKDYAGATMQMCFTNSPMGSAVLKTCSIVSV